MDREILRYEILNLGIKISKIKNIESKLDIIIEKYYSREIKFNSYLNSKNKLVRMILEGEFPTVKEWNDIAKKNGYFSNVSIEYITGYNWKKLEKALRNEIKEILLKE